MAWDTDLIEACYTAPSGKKFTFQYDAKLTSETDLKTATFTFPERDGALVVPLGIGGRRFSFTCFFYGSRSKTLANNFEEGLKERGYGELQHPLYGIHKVVPTGTIVRNDDVVSGVGISSVGVTFAETMIDVSTINSEVVLNDTINSGVENFEKKSVWEFCKNIGKATIKGVIWAGNMFKKGMEVATDVLTDIARTEKDIYTKYQVIENELFASISDVINSAETIAVQTVKLLRLPAQTSADVAVKIASYAQVVENLIINFKNDPAGIENAKNQWASTRLMLESLAVACASGVATLDVTEFKSRDEAVEAAESILDIYDSVVDFEESKISKDFFVETGDGFDAMRDVVANSVSQIIQSSFSLPTRKTILLGRDRQIVELLYELYGSLDKLDEFIVDNNINYNELEVIPMGREVAYYV